MQIREQQELPVSAFYDFYVEKGGTLDYSKFQKIFFSLIASGQPVPSSNGVMKIIRYDVCIHKLYNHYDKKFGLNINKE